MKSRIIVTLAITLAAVLPLGAQTPTSPANEPATAAPDAVDVEAPQKAPEKSDDLYSNLAGLALEGYTVDTSSSKFEEYIDRNRGVGGGHFRLFNVKGSNLFLATGRNVLQEDRRINVLADTSKVRIDAFYDSIPHRLGNNAKSILTPVSSTAWGLSDLAQRAIQTRLEQQYAANRTAINYAFLRALVEPLINTPYLFDLGYTRERAGIALSVVPAAEIDTVLTYFQENREGYRNAGTSFGFGNVVETAEPIRFMQRDVGVRLEKPLSLGLIRGAFTVNEFQNEVTSYTFDNPFRAVDSTDASAYTAPGSGSINGPAFGRIALAPDSTQATASVGGIFKFARNSRLTADFAYGRIDSNSALIPYTTNTAMTSPFNASDPASLPHRSFDGDIATTSFNLQFTTRPIRNLRLNARYRMYEHDNQTDRVEIPGYARFDAAWEDIPRRTVPYGWSTHLAELSGQYDFGRITTLELGFRSNKVERTYRETEETTENMFRIGADFRPLSWIVARTSFEFGSRDYDEYDQVRGESASFEEEEQGNIPGLRRYDQAKKDSNRIVAMVQASPGSGNFTVAVNYVRYLDDYNASEFGLQRWRTQSLNLEADYSPSNKWSIFGFAGTDSWYGFQTSRQSGATFSTNPLDNWSAKNTDRAITFGGGANYIFVPDRFDVRLSGQLQRVNGFADLESPPGGTPDIAFDVPHVDDTRWLQALAEFTYKVSPSWHVSFGAWTDTYDIEDDPTSNTQQYMPAGFFLVPNDANYSGSGAFVRTTYRW